MLHAWVDGEATDPEREIARELLDDSDEARLYVAELERLRILLATHGGVSAPTGLRERVRSALQRECETPIHQLPLVNFRALGLAAAAAVVVSLGLLFAQRFTQTGGAPQNDRVALKSEAGQASRTAPALDPRAASVERRSRKSDCPANPTPPQRLTELSDSVEDAREARPDALSANLDQPFEVSVNMNRGRRASVLQVYNDLLLVGSLYGDARLREGEDDPQENFAGHDFAAYDGLEVELEEAKVPGLLASLTRMTADQGYGDMVVPADLRKQVQVCNDEIEELQAELSDVADMVERSNSRTAGGVPKRAKDAPATFGAQGYLPPQLQRECLCREAEALKKGAHGAALNGLLDKCKEREEAGNKPYGHNRSPRHAGGTVRKIRLLIHLR